MEITGRTWFARMSRPLWWLLPMAFLFWLYSDGLKVWFISDDFAWLGLFARSSRVGGLCYQCLIRAGGTGHHPPVEA